MKFVKKLRHLWGARGHFGTERCAIKIKMGARLINALDSNYKKCYGSNTVY